MNSKDEAMQELRTAVGQSLKAALSKLDLNKTSDKEGNFFNFFFFFLNCMFGHLQYVSFTIGRPNRSVVSVVVERQLYNKLVV